MDLLVDAGDALVVADFKSSRSWRNAGHVKAVADQLEAAPARPVCHLVHVAPNLAGPESQRPAAAALLPDVDNNST